MARVRRRRRARALGLVALLLSAAISTTACGLRYAVRSDALQQAFETQVETASQRVRQRVPEDVLANFGLIVYVDKAETGPLAQHMVVLERQAGERLAPLYVWPVSTGRGDIETDARGQPESTDTPEGVFTVDPKRIYASYMSSEWNETMPYAMFLSGPADARDSGLAIHAATGGSIARIGARASAGCIHLSPENARTLFDLVRKRFAGRIPELARRSDAASAAISLQQDARGRLKRANGYSVLVVIDDYPGEAIAATAIPSVLADASQPR